MSEQEDEVEVAEPFRFNFEIAWEVANKGVCVLLILLKCICIAVTNTACSAIDATMHPSSLIALNGKTLGRTVCWIS